MKRSRVLLIGCLLAGAAVISCPAVAQFPHLPKLPGVSKHGDDDSRARRRGKPSGADEPAEVHAAGVPVPADSPIFAAFERLGQQSVYHQRMSLAVDDPQMQQIMAQMGFRPAEITVAGDTKQVSMHFKMPVSGQVEDFELRAVTRNGRIAKRWISPASGRIIKEQEASIAKQFAEAEVSSAKSIAQNIATGPAGWVSAGVSAGAAAANIAEAARARKQAHDFFEWSCLNASAPAAPPTREPPPLTDLRVIGDQTLNGAAVTAYEFFVRENGKFNGPMQMLVAKDSGLPVRISVSDPQGRGGMHMDYYGFNQNGEIEIPSCLAEAK